MTEEQKSIVFTVALNAAGRECGGIGGVAVGSPLRAARIVAEAALLVDRILHGLDDEQRDATGLRSG